MLEEFESHKARGTLWEALANQELVLRNRVIAERLAEVAKLEEYKNGEDVFLEGEPSTHKLYFILSGAFEILVRGNRIREVKGGEAMGELPILDPGLGHTVTLRASEPSVIATIREDQFLSIADQNPAIWRNMAKMEAKRLLATYQTQWTTSGA